MHTGVLRIVGDWFFCCKMALAGIHVFGPTAIGKKWELCRKLLLKNQYDRGHVGRKYRGAKRKNLIILAKNNYTACEIELTF